MENAICTKVYRQASMDRSSGALFVHCTPAAPAKEVLGTARSELACFLLDLVMLLFTYVARQRP